MRGGLTQLDLPAYLERLGLSAPPEPSLEGVAELMGAHLAAIPFENIDVRLGRPIRLDLPSLESKLVRGGRGGYCFEQNTLAAAALRRLGVEVATFEARVRPPGAVVVLPRTHMTLRVEADDASWLVDVGFGGDAPLRPVPFSGEEVEDSGGVYRLAREGERVRVLQRRTAAGWSDLYAFLSEPALPVDFEVANHFTSTHPRSIFVQTLTAQRSTAEAFHVLRGRLYTRSGEAAEERADLDDAQVHELLTGVYGLRVELDEVRGALRGL
ncbi:MAG: arylamine N-acetyltransferase [Thermoanaerobaculia bacterium]